MKQKNYSFERVNGASDHVELHRSKGHRFHLLAKLLCLVLALVFWLFVHALQSCELDKDNGAAKKDESSAVEQENDDRTEDVAA
ncbi:MAG: hypothetical protein IJW40_04730 [Clostridia bacterium]|nr:hypothetical protein [Clostridia bacterium]